MAWLLAWAVLAGFAWYYLRPLSLGLGETHVAFRTARVEPKLAALRVVEGAATSQPVEIIARGWWAYWPLAYLAGADPQLRIVPLDVPGERSLARTDDADQWRVEFVEEQKVVPFAPFSPLHIRTSLVIPDAAGRPLLRIIPAATGSSGQVPLAD
jgi:hypothetical protein